MREFQVGDKVEYRFINEFLFCYGLVNGEIYTIEFINEYENHISLKDEKGFKLRQDLMREDKLNKLLTK